MGVKVDSVSSWRYDTLANQIMCLQKDTILVPFLMIRLVIKLPPQASSSTHLPGLGSLQEFHSFPWSPWMSLRNKTTRSRYPDGFYPNGSFSGGQTSESRRIRWIRARSARRPRASPRWIPTWRGPQAPSGLGPWPPLGLGKLGPPGALSHPFFGWEGSPTQIDYQKKGYPYSILSTGGPRSESCY